MEEHPKEILGISGGISDIGVQTVAVPYYAPSLEEAAVVAQGRIVNGLPEVGRTWTVNEAGIFLVTVTYQGQTNPSPQNNPSLVRTAVRASFKEEPIEAHPKIDEIMKKYGGRMRPDKTVEFDMFYTPSSGGGLGLAGNSSKQVKNPFFGIVKFLKLEVTFTRTYAAAEIPATLLLRIGKAVSRPQGAPAGIEGRRRWLVMPPYTQTQGNVTEVNEEYLLMDENTPDELYELAE